tara:strand:+ start:44186 stop:44848 length:663 start_codon:yes stop_codon:yes gene_type:complete
LGKNKLKKFYDLDQFSHVIQPNGDNFHEIFYLKGKWAKDFFNNNNPIVLELGCGKGEYSVSLAERYPKKNFIGIDIKGNRIWTGATASKDKNLKNICFLRIRIENILNFFDRNEISEIWLTFPDPQIKKKRQRKRLTHPEFLTKYSNILGVESHIHLKTDSQFLYGYTLGVIESGGHELIDCTNDLYSVDQVRKDMDILTYYEKIYVSKGFPITYTKFRI